MLNGKDNTTQSPSISSVTLKKALESTTDAPTRAMVAKANGRILDLEIDLLTEKAAHVHTQISLAKVQFSNMELQKKLQASYAAYVKLQKKNIALLEEHVAKHKLEEAKRLDGRD